MITHLNEVLIKNEEDFKAKIDNALKSMTKYLILKVVYGNDTNDVVIRVSYHLRKRKILIVSDGKDEQLEMYKRQLELQGASVVSSTNPGAYNEGDWDGVLISSSTELKGKSYEEIIKNAAEKKQVIGLVNKAPALLINAPENYKEKKVTMDKDVSPSAIKAGLNYTGKEVETDGTVVTSTGFDRKTAKSFLEAFAGMVSRKTDARD